MNCHYCGRIFAAPFAPQPSGDERWKTRDHVVPRCRGGTNEPWNIVAACWRCNIDKGTKPAFGFRLGEPRTDWGPPPSRLTAILRPRPSVLLPLRRFVEAEGL